MVFERVESSQLFYTKADFEDGMNSVALGQYQHNVVIIGFNLMVNHAHFAVQADGNNCVEFFYYLVQRINSRLSSEGHKKLPSDYSFKLVRIESERQMSDVLIYIARNPYKARKDIVPSGYPWGTNNLMFNRSWEYFERKSLESISLEEQRRLFKSRIKLPQHYCFSTRLGIVLPGSYARHDIAESAIGNSWNYCNRLVKDMDAYLRIAEGIGETVFVSDEELDLIIFKILTKRFNVRKASELSIEDRCKVAVQVRKQYNIEPKRLSRKLGLTYSIVAQLFE